MAVTYAQLRATHPTYDAARTREYRALAAGGHTLLRDDALMARVFPQHAGEPPWVYAQRRARAIYVPYAGEILGDLVALLGADPLVVTAKPALDPWYAGFVADVDRQRSSLTTFAQNAVRTALTERVAWTLVDLPLAAPEPLPSLADQERAGGLRAYLVALETDAVLDWEEDEEGKLTWACVRSVRATRTGPGDDRSDVLERFTVYYPDRWERYEVTYKAEKPPQPQRRVPLVAAGAHSFGAVPLVRLTMPAGLWALDKLAPLARAHLNLCSAIDWSQNKHLFPMMMAFLTPSDPASPDEVNGSRATEQTYGTGYINTFASSDRVEYVTPDTGVYEHAMRRCDSIRDEQHRVTHAMALAVDNSAGAMGRSGDSKEEDRMSRWVVAREIGRIAREAVVEMMHLVAAGRGDALDELHVCGLEEFDAGEDVSEALAEGTLLASLNMPSPTFRTVMLRSVAVRIARKAATPEELDTIRAELAAPKAAEGPGEDETQPPVP